MVNTRRTNGWVVSSTLIIGFVFKCGNALGGMIPGLVLSATGYVATTQHQTAGALHGIVIATTIVPIIIYFIAIFSMKFYNLDKETYKRISAELKERNAKELAEEAAANEEK